MNASIASLGNPVLTWLADYYLVATFLLLAALVGWRWVRQPAHRLLIAWTVMLELAVLAVVCALPFWPRVSLVAAPPGVAVDSPVKHEAPVTAELPMPFSPVATIDSRIAENSRSSEPSEAASDAASPPVAASHWAWNELAAAVFLTGVAAAALWLCWGAAAASLLCWKARPASESLKGELLEIVKGTEVVVAKSLGQRNTSSRQPPPSPSHRRAPRLLVSPRIANAVALGVLRPTIVLPAAMVQSSPPQTLRAVLLHEWAHIRHRDLWLLALGRFLLAVLFAHPLFWWLRRTIRTDQELLADAAAAGENRHDYAQELVQLVRMTVHPSPMTVSAAVGIWEGPSQLSKRIAMLVDDTFRIEPTGSRRWRYRALGVLLLLGAAISLLTLQPNSSTGKPDGATASAEPTLPDSPWKVTLPNGVIIELIGLAPNPSDGQAWWRPDGSPLPDRPYVNKQGFLSKPAKNRRAVEVAYRVISPEPGSHPHSLSIPDNLGMGSFLCRDAKGECVNDVDATNVLFPTEQKTMNLVFGGVAGPWERAATLGPKGGQCVRADLPFAGFAISQKSDGEFVVNAVLGWRWDLDYSYRLLVIDQDGAEHWFRDGLPKDVTPEKKVRHWTFTDPKRARHPLTSIKEIRFEFRRFQFAEFKNVSLQAGETTQVQVTVVADAKQGNFDKSPQQPWAKEVTAAMPGYEIEHCDSQPSPIIGSHRGYRIVLRKGEKEYRSAGQQTQLAQVDMPFVMRYRHIELAAFTDAKVTPDESGKIAWQQWKDEPSYLKKTVHLGRGMGLNWYANTTVLDQELLRDRLKLEGGDDRLALLTEALLIDDAGSWTRNSCVHLLARAGDRAIPYIKKAVASHKNGDKAVYALAFIQTPAATEYLQTLYASDATRNAAIYALVHTPLRQSAKDQYFDMLRRRLRLVEPMWACVQFEWKDALPLISEIYLRPQSFGEFVKAFETKRQLEGRPIAEEIKRAYQNPYFLAKQEGWDRFRDALLKSPDTESVIVAAIDMSFVGGKVSSEERERVNRLGRDILRQLPRKQVETAILRLVRSFEALPSMRPTAKELARVLSEPASKQQPAAGVTRIDNRAAQPKRDRSISGRVLYYDGTPAAGASVFLVGSNTSAGIGQGKAWQGERSDVKEDKTIVKAIADATGRFKLPGGDAKSIAISAPKLDFWVVPVPDGVPMADGDEVSRPEFTIKLPEAGRLVVKYDIPGGAARAELFLQFNTWNPPLYRGVGYTPGATVANKGQVVLDNLPPGKFYLDRPKTIAYSTRYCDRRLITVESGKTVESNFIRDRGTAVIGQVVGLKKEMCASVCAAPNTAGAFISVRSSEAKGGVVSDMKLPLFDILMCGLDGRFKTEQLLPGKYAIIVETWLPEKPEERGHLGIRRSSFIGRTIVTVPESGPPPQITVELKPRENPPPVKPVPNAKNPNADITGTVLLPDGSPAVGASVAISLKSNEVVVQGGKVRYGFSRQPAKLVTTAADGSFRLPAADGLFHLPAANELARRARDTGAWVIVVAHDGGYAEATAAEFAKQASKMQLKPWGRIEGKFELNGKPMAGNQIHIGAGRGDVDVILSYSDDVTTDVAGNFVAERVPPVRLYISPHLKQDGGSYSPFWFSGLTSIAPGKTTRITVPRPGRAVIGRVALPPKSELRLADLAIDATIFLRPPSVWGDPEWGRKEGNAYSKFMTSEHAKAFRRDKIAVNADGTFRIEGLPETDYMIQVQATGKGLKAGAFVAKRVTVPPLSDSKDPVDVGDLVLRENTPPAKPSKAAAVTIVELPMPNSVGVSEKQAEARKHEILSNTPTPPLEKWKNPYTGFCIHIHKDDSITIYNVLGDDSLGGKKRPAKRFSVAEIRELANGFPHWGNPVGILITSDLPLKESKVIHKILDAVFSSVQLFYARSSESGGAAKGGRPSPVGDK